MKEIYLDAKSNNESTARKKKQHDAVMQSMTQVEIQAPPPLKLSDAARKSMQRAQLTYSQKHKTWSGPKSHESEHMARYWAAKQGSFL
jgi:hypothetical protein